MYIDTYEFKECLDCLSEHPKGVLRGRVIDYKTAAHGYLVLTITRPDSIMDEVSILMKSPEDGKLPIYKKGKIAKVDDIILDDEVLLCYKSVTVGCDSEGWLQVYFTLVDGTVFCIPWISLEKWQLEASSEDLIEHR